MNHHSRNLMISFPEALTPRDKTFVTETPTPRSSSRTRSRQDPGDPMIFASDNKAVGMESTSSASWAQSAKVASWNPKRGHDKTGTTTRTASAQKNSTRPDTDPRPASRNNKNYPRYP